MLAVTELIYLLVAVGLALLAGYLLQKKNKSLVQDDKPTTLVHSTRPSKRNPYARKGRRRSAR